MTTKTEMKNALNAARTSITTVLDDLNTMAEGLPDPAPPVPPAPDPVPEPDKPVLTLVIHNGEVISDEEFAYDLNGFSIRAVVPDEAGQVEKVTFSIPNGVHNRTETLSPYWMFGDNQGAQAIGTLPGNPVAELTVTAYPAQGDPIVRVLRLTPQGANPQPTEEVLLDVDFRNGLQGFLRAGTGVMNITSEGIELIPGGSGYNGILHYYKGVGKARPGDTIKMRALVKCGPLRDNLSDKGVGIGADYRLVPGGKPSITRNAQASTSPDWCWIEDEITIPARAFSRKDNWGAGSIKRASDGEQQPSGTSGVMNFGINSESKGTSNDAAPYQTKDLPEMDFVAWLHGWGTSVQKCWVQQMKITRVRP